MPKFVVDLSYELEESGSGIDSLQDLFDGVVRKVKVATSADDVEDLTWAITQGCVDYPDEGGVLMVFWTTKKEREKEAKKEAKAKATRAATKKRLEAEKEAKDLAEYERLKEKYGK